MIEKIEVAKSDLSVCKWCGRKIKKLQIRGVTDFGGFVCRLCLNFDKMIEEIREVEKQFKEMIKLTNQERKDILIKGKVINKLK